MGKAVQLVIRLIKKLLGGFLSIPGPITNQGWHQ
jgi:hypothetical protein